MRRGTIIEFQGSYMSGLATLVVDVDGQAEGFFCDNGQTERSLIHAFGCAGEGHTIDNEKLYGNEVFFEEDSIGMMESFVPVAELTEDEIEELNKLCEVNNE